MHINWLCFCKYSCLEYMSQTFLLNLSEARRRKWLEDNPESSSNEDPILFDTSIIPWWAWMKRFHLPEAELLNGYFWSLPFRIVGLIVVDDSFPDTRSCLHLWRSRCNDWVFHGISSRQLDRSRPGWSNGELLLQNSLICSCCRRSSDQKEWRYRLSEEAFWGNHSLRQAVASSLEGWEH